MWCGLLPVTGMPNPAVVVHCGTLSILHVFLTIPCPLVKKGAKEFVDQNMLRSQRTRKRRRQQRATNSSCPGPSGSAEESKEADSDHETTSSSGRTDLTAFETIRCPFQTGVSQYSSCLY